MTLPAQSAGNAAGQPGRPDQRLPRSRRLTRSALFQETYAQGRTCRGRLMLLRLRAGDDAGLRLGVVASRRVGNAVCRARAKRLMREAYRRNRHRFTGNYDVVLSARSDMLEASWDAIVKELLWLAKRAGILRRPEAGGEES